MKIAFCKLAEKTVCLCWFKIQNPALLNILTHAKYIVTN